MAQRKISPGLGIGLAPAPKPPQRVVNPGLEFGIPYTPPAAAPSAPAYTPPSSPAQTPPPVDPGYQATVGGLARQRDDTYADIAGRQTRGLLDYGYNADLTIDPSNPFSRANLLQKSYQQQKAGNVNGMAARGQLYSGALQNAQNQTEYGYQQGSDSLEKQVISFLAGLGSEKATAGTNYEIGAGQALGTSTANAPSSPPYTPTPAASTSAAPQLAGRKIAKTVGGVNYYKTASGMLAPIPKGAPIIK